MFLKSHIGLQDENHADDKRVQIFLGYTHLFS
jgi:hypothetical protein